MQPWVWLLIIIVIILVVWWLMSRSAKNYEAGFEIDRAESVTIEEPEAASEQEVEEVPPAPPTKPDDLTILEGIGPKVNKLLQTAGIATFSQLASADVGRLKEILEANELQFMDPSTWPEQAKLAAEGKTEELKALQDSLKGGRKAA
jgi:predicted flap endonuclease-1-like 5' DNA nuclease